MNKTTNVLGCLFAASLLIAACASDPTQPNPVKSGVSKAMGKLRADEDMFDLLMTYSSLKPKAVEKLDPVSARKNPTLADAVKVMLSKQGKSTDPQTLVPGVTSQDTTVDGAAGKLPARIYTPEGSGPFPVVVYFHGGGWVIANKDVYDGGARGLSKQAGAVVVSADYRLAPEHKFPAAWDDALAVYQWTIAHASNLNGNPRKIALAGESAGGNLAVATAIAARDGGVQKPVHVLSIYPVTQTSLNTESYLENAVAMPANRAMMQWFFDHTTRSPQDLKDPRLQLIDAKLQDLPPVTIINARIDVLRTDGAKLEDALKSAGVPVERKDYEGVTHEFFYAAAVLAKAREAQEYAGQRLKESFTQ